MKTELVYVWERINWLGMTHANLGHQGTICTKIRKLIGPSSQLYMPPCLHEFQNMVNNINKKVFTFFFPIYHWYLNNWYFPWLKLLFFEIVFTTLLLCIQITYFSFQFSSTCCYWNKFLSFALPPFKNCNGVFKSLKYKQFWFNLVKIRRY